MQQTFAVLSTSAVHHKVCPFGAVEALNFCGGSFRLHRLVAFTRATRGACCMCMGGLLDCRLMYRKFLGRDFFELDLLRDHVAQSI